MSFIDKVASRLRRDAGVSIERTHVYKREHTDAPLPDVTADVDRVARILARDVECLCALGCDARDEWRQRFERGDQCYGAWRGSHLVHYSWVQTCGAHMIDAAGLEVPVRERELWIYNCRTSELHRGQRIYPHTLQHILREQFGAGATTAWIYTTERNIPSRRGVERAGFTLMHILRALRLGRRYRALDNEHAAPGRSEVAG